MNFYLDSLFISLEAINVQLGIGPDLVIFRVADNVHDGRLVLTQYEGFASDFDQEISDSLLVLFAHLLVALWVSKSYFCGEPAVSKKIDCGE